jgi:hypothetical protein
MTEITQAQTEVQAKAAYLIQRDARKRFSFGKVWIQAVLAGKVSDKDKLVAHAVKLKAGRKYDLKKLKDETLLAKVQAKLQAEQA